MKLGPGGNILEKHVYFDIIVYFSSLSCCRFHENEMIVRLGTRNRNRRGSNEQVYPISCLHIHGKYSRETKTNSIDYDIALLRLKTPVTKTSEPRGMVFNDHVAPACLPIRGEFQAGAVCIVTGWGYTGVYC